MFFFLSFFYGRSQDLAAADSADGLSSFKRFFRRSARCQSMRHLVKVLKPLINLLIPEFYLPCSLMCSVLTDIVLKESPSFITIPHSKPSSCGSGFLHCECCKTFIYLIICLLVICSSRQLVIDIN